MDKTCIKVKEERVCPCRAVDRFGNTLDVRLSRRRNKPAASKCPACAMAVNGLPRKIVTDKSAADTEGVKDINRILRHFGCPARVQMVRIRYPHNPVGQDHRFSKRRVRRMPGFNSFTSAASIIGGIELVNMIRKGQCWANLRSVQQFRQFAA